MGIALLTLSTLIQRLFLLSLRHKRPLATPALQESRRFRVAPGCVRIFRPNSCTANEARFAITGRMADVCAELERLAANDEAWR
ncbi:hypothetical protein [Extensimonas vulgaris]|uniref:Uncharacterized protein n=1 Tax=Extensimonas vulgaris TaxID=1031594 RepID=A0A369ANH7_9BURK|nr:hypothetical protein [Extensimonas vulgaris]RCX08994.1 hypothetical protein DFR45_10774 [Extensimonas vulgaris]TWI37230.1 hypothetical protein IP95_02154 [Extensimonas vulgaris]TXD14282.1 hypothetical protein FUT63_09845 [Extensimonas vulgaris]